MCPTAYRAVRPPGQYRSLQLPFFGTQRTQFGLHAGKRVHKAGKGDL